MDFRAFLIKHGEAISFALQSGKSDVRRAQHWLKNEQQQYLKKVHGKCQENTARTKLELLRKKNLHASRTNSCIDEKKAYEKAKRQLEEIETKIKNVQKWSTQLDKEALDFNGQLQALTSLVDTTLPKAQHRLEQMVLALEKYHEVATTSSENQSTTTDINMQRALPDQAIDITIALAISLRDNTPIHQLRIDAPLDDTVSFRESFFSALDFDSINIDCHQQAFLPTDKIIIDRDAIYTSPVYLERIAPNAQKNDSGWYLGTLHNNTNRQLTSTTIEDIQYDCPSIKKLLLMPYGSLIILTRQGVAIILDPNNDVLINHGNNQ